jgi:hypothetical protein
VRGDLRRRRFERSTAVADVDVRRRRVDAKPREPLSDLLGRRRPRVDGVRCERIGSITLGALALTREVLLGAIEEPALDCLAVDLSARESDAELAAAGVRRRWRDPELGEPTLVVLGREVPRVDDTDWTRAGLCFVGRFGSGAAAFFASTAAPRFCIMI